MVVGPTVIPLNFESDLDDCQDAKKKKNNPGFFITYYYVLWQRSTISEYSECSGYNRYKSLKLCSFLSTKVEFFLNSPVLILVDRGGVFHLVVCVYSS